MAFDRVHPGVPPSQKGWGPHCDVTLVSHPLFRPSLNKEIAELVDLIVYEAESKGFRFMTPGCWGYACKTLTGGDGSTWSFHAWGLAVDVNAPRNVFGASRSQSQIATEALWLARLFERYGFLWLGPVNDDWMHFQFCGSVFDAKRMTERARKELGDVKYEEFKAGVQAYWNDKPEPASGEERFGWNFARRGETKPLANDPGAHGHPLEEHRHQSASQTGGVV